MPPILLMYAMAVVLSILRRTWIFFLPFVKVFTARAPPASSRRFMWWVLSSSDQRPPVLICSVAAPQPRSDASVSMTRSGVRGRIGRPFHLLSIVIHHSSSVFDSLFRNTIVWKDCVLFSVLIFNSWSSL